MEPAAILRAVVGAALLAWLPGYVWVRAFGQGRTRIERAVLSIAVSIALLASALYLGNVALDVAITPRHAVWYAIAIALAGLVPAMHRRVSARFAESVTPP